MALCAVIISYKQGNTSGRLLRAAMDENNIL